MSRAYLYIDGVEYQLQHDIPSIDDDAFARLKQQVELVLERSDTRRAVTQMRAGVPGGPVHFDVRLNGCDADLLVVPGSVNVAAVYLRPAPASPMG